MSNSRSLEKGRRGQCVTDNEMSDRDVAGAFNRGSAANSGDIARSATVSCYEGCPENNYLSSHFNRKLCLV